MATLAECAARMIEREAAEGRGLDPDVYAGPVLFTEEEWAVMLTDPAFGYVCRYCGSARCDSLDPRGTGECFAGEYDHYDEEDSADGA